MLTCPRRPSRRRRSVWMAAAVALVALVASACDAPLDASSSGAAGANSGASQTHVTETDAASPASAASSQAAITSSPTAAPSTVKPDTANDAASPTSTATSPQASSTATTSSTAPVAPTATTQPSAGAAVAVTAADRAEAARRVAAMSTADKAASVLMVTGSETVGTGALRRQHFGGVILFAPGGVVDGTSNGTPAQVAAVTAGLRKDAASDSAGAPPLIATDQEYGAVQRLKHGFTTFPRAATLGAIPAAEAPTLTRDVATAAAQEMRAVGVTVDFAPVFGVLPASGGPSAIGEFGRSYGANPQRVASLVAAAITGYQAGGVISAMKHFPGLARIGADSHVTLPILPATCADWNAHEAIPAKAGIAAGPLMVMTAHMLLPAAGDTKLPASVSPDIVTGLLKGAGVRGCEGMNYQGVTVTDSLQMEPIVGHYSSGDAAVAALNAGEDLLLMSANPTKAIAGIVAAVRSGALPADRLDDAATAVLALRIASARVPTPPLTVVNSPAHQKLAREASAAAQ